VAASVSAVEQILGLASAALESGDADAFLENVERYLTAFEDWQRSAPAELEGLTEAERDEYRQQVNALAALHNQVTANALERKGEVLSRIGEIRHRTMALKRYIDRYPSRITIAGKREGR